MRTTWHELWTHVHLATMVENGEPYGAIRDGALAVAHGRVAWLGKMSELPHRDAARVHKGDGRWMTPALIDCHTHLVFAADRAGEFEQRLNGARYEDIARAGGGILSSVRATREASEHALHDSARVRLEALRHEAVGTIEIKSGYGLDLDTECKMLRVARQLGRETGVRVVATFLGAHAVPPEFEGRRDAYVDYVCGPMLDAIAREHLADAVDVFGERIGFAAEETARIFTAARDKGLRVKLHADQLSDQGGAALAARFNALSADHLEYASEDGIAAMARSGTVAVLLPGAFYFLRETRVPPIDLLRKHRVPMAVATDCNPGSSPTTSLLLMLNMACTLFRLTPEEALAGVTRHAAKALALDGEIGTLEVGKRGEVALWNVESPAQLAYWIGSGVRPECHLAEVERGRVASR